MNSGWPTAPRPSSAVHRGRPLVVVGMVYLLAACGGGSGTSHPNDTRDAAAPEGDVNGVSIVLEAPIALPDSRWIGLRWHAAGATDYRLEIQRDAGAPFEFIPGYAASEDRSGATFFRGATWRLDFPTARVRVVACAGGEQCVTSNEQPLQDVLLAGIRKLIPGADYLPARDFATRTAISTDGNTLVASGDGDKSTVAGESGQGSVFVYRRDTAGAWTREARLERFSAPVAFGPDFALSGDGNTLVVGAPTNGGTVGGNNPPEVGYPGPAPALGDLSGAAYIYVRDAQVGWRRQAYLKAPQPRAGERFGSSLAINEYGNRLIVGAAGRVHVFERDCEEWRAMAVLVPPPGPEPSTVIGVAQPSLGAWVAVSTVENGRGSGVAARKVLIYEICLTCDELWRFAAALRSAKPIVTGFDDAFGAGGPSDPGKAMAFSADGRVLAIGARLDSGDINDVNIGGTSQPVAQGSIYVFRRSEDGVWQREAYLRTRSAHGYDFVGSQLAISADGRAIATKACGTAAFDARLRRNHAADAVVGPVPPGTLPDCSSVGNNVYAGAVYVFEPCEDGLWRHVTAVIPEPGRSGSFERTSLSFSGDAETLSYSVALFDEAITPHRLVVY
jgi:hypothetical protein